MFQCNYCYCEINVKWMNAMSPFKTCIQFQLTPRISKMDIYQYIEPYDQEKLIFKGRKWCKQMTNHVPIDVKKTPYTSVVLCMCWSCNDDVSYCSTTFMVHGFLSSLFITHVDESIFALLSMPSKKCQGVQMYKAWHMM